MNRPKNDDYWMVELNIGIYTVVVFVIFLFLFANLDFHP